MEETTKKLKDTAVFQEPTVSEGPNPSRMICLGASAGGLEALERFFRSVPEEARDIFVIVQHLSPDHKSIMTELLRRYTLLPAVVVDEGMIPEPGRIHLIPPGKDMILREGVFRLQQRSPRDPHFPINGFLQSMARDWKGPFVSVILSGTGSDGSLGIQAVHAAGGLVLAQDVGSARFDGMPRNAELTRVVDFIGTPEQIVSVLYEEVRESGEAPGACVEMFAASKGSHPPISPRDRIFQKISDVFNVDFSQYKDATILRRLERRMALRDVADMEDYAEILEAEEEELDHLYRDLLIDVTSFFRDAEAFSYLGEQVLSEMLQSHPEEQEFRVWVVACASGEEPYSIAIMLQEILGLYNLRRIVRIFATDIHQKSLRSASNGIYSEEKLKNLSPELREKYFLRKENGLWAVRPFVRRTITFAPHNILADPPFLHMNLISCRNMLIYLEKSAQLEVLTRFAAALELQGVLFLGKSESIPEELRDFAPLESRLKIYQKQGSFATRSLHALLPEYKGFAGKKSPERGRDSLGVLFPILLDRCMPPGFLVDSRGNLLYTFGGAGKYLRLQGPVSTEISSLLQGNLRIPVSTALERAKKKNDAVLFSNVADPFGATSSDVLEILAEPLKVDEETSFQGRTFYFIRITPVKKYFVESGNTPRDSAGEILEEHSRIRIEALEHDLMEARENLQTMIEELETANEELQATNEELLASNEELQSSNEELQSVNEEMHSLNAEYQEKNEQLLEVNTDLQNLMECTDIGTIFLDRKLQIRRYTPSINRVFYLRDQDLGRPIEEVRSLVEEDASLLDSLHKVLREGVTEEREIRTRQGLDMLQRLHPYRDVQGAISGVVLTFVDVSGMKASERERFRSDATRRGVLDSLDAHMAVLDREGNIVAINRKWEQFAQGNGARDFGTLSVGANYFGACACSPDESGYDDAQRAIHGIRSVLGGRAELFEMEYPCHSPQEKRWFLMRVLPLQLPEGGAVVSHVNITVKREALRALQESQFRLQHVLNSIDALIFVSHLETFEILMINDFGVRLFGDAVGKKCWEVFKKDCDAPCKKCVKGIFEDAAKEPGSGEIRRWQEFNSLTGRWFECRSTVIPWTDPPAVRLEISVDITENKKVEEQLRLHRDQLDRLVQEQTEELREKNEALERQGVLAQEMAVRAQEASESKSAFLANMSHEIRTPINAIIGFAELLQESPLSEEAMEFVQIISQNGEALLHLVNDVLDFSRIEARKLVLESIACNLRDIMEDVSHSLALGAQKKGVAFVCSVDPSLPEVIYGDPARIRQILLNLGNNAVKFTSRGEVVLSAEFERRKKGSSGILFAVRDTGEGISREKQGRLFQKFSQVDASTSRNYGGSGLGLAISKGLVEMMGGEIGVESVEGKGSLFWFFLPLAMSASPPEAPQGVANLRVLLALSEESAAKALHRQLVFWNMRPLRVAPEEILPQLKRAQDEGDSFGLLFMDTPPEEKMEESLLGHPEKEFLLSGTRVVLLDPLESRQKKNTLKEQSKVFVLSKPYRYRELLHVVMAGGHGL